MVSLSGSRNKVRTDVCLHLLVQERFTNSLGALCWGCAALVLGKLSLAPTGMFSADSEACFSLCVPTGAWEELTVLFVLTLMWLNACVRVTVFILLISCVNLVISVTDNMLFDCTCISWPFPVNLHHLNNAGV